MSAGLILLGASAGLNVMSGAFGYLMSRTQAQIAESRGRLLRLEADIEAQRYAEQAEQFKGRQLVSIVKSGVKVEGSPLDILAETARVASENISAIQARGRAQQVEQDTLAANARAQGRMAFIQGIAGGFQSFGNMYK